MIVVETILLFSSQSGEKIPGKLTGYDPITGFGVVSPLIPTELKPLKIGDSDKWTTIKNMPYGL